MGRRHLLTRLRRTTSRTVMEGVLWYARKQTGNLTHSRGECGGFVRSWRACNVMQRCHTLTSLTRLRIANSRTVVRKLRYTDTVSGHACSFCFGSCMCVLSIGFVSSFAVEGSDSPMRGRTPCAQFSYGLGFVVPRRGELSAS